MKKLTLIIAVFTLIGGLALGVYLTLQETKIPTSAVAGDFEFGFSSQIEACETTTVNGWIKNTSGRTANNIRLWLNPTDAGRVIEPEWPTNPGKGWIDTMDDGEVVNVVLEFNPVDIGVTKSVRFWVDAAFATSQSGTFDFTISCMVTPTPIPPTNTPIPTDTPIPTNTPTSTPPPGVTPTITPTPTVTPIPTPTLTPTPTGCPLSERVEGVEIICPEF